MPACLPRPARSFARTASSARATAGGASFFARRSAALLLLFLLIGGTPGTSRAQPAAPSDSTTAPPPLITNVSFEGNNVFSDAALVLRTRTQPNRRFLGVPGLTWWLWLYRLGAGGTFGGRLGEALMATGEAPAFLDATGVRADVERLQLFYRQEGFREAEVVAEIDTTDGGRHAEVTYHIDEGPPTFIRRVIYEGVGGLEPGQQLALARGALLRPRKFDRTDPLRFEVRQQRYSEPVLLEERRRLLTFLRNAGYAAISRDSIRAIVFAPSPDTFDVRFRIRPGPRFRFSNVHFEVSGPEAGALPRRDTLLATLPEDERPGGTVTAHLTHESTLDPGLLLRVLQFRPGEWYDQARVLATKRRLEATGLFSFSDIAPLSADTACAGTAPCLPHRIELHTRPRHQIRLETFMLQRNNVLLVSGSELGTGLGVSYENANLFGAGEAFRLSTTGSVATPLSADTDQRFFTSAQFEVSSSLTFPYLVRPFRRLDRALDLYDARTRLSLSWLTARRDELRLVIRGRGAAGMRLEMQHTPTITSLVDVLDLSLSNPDTLVGFRREFLDQILGPQDSTLVTDPVQRAQILEDYTQPQINNALRYTLRSARVNPLRRDQGYSYEGALEVGGNLPYLLDRFVYSPGEVEGDLPGLTFSGSADSRLLYRRYVRLATDLRRYRRLSRASVLALKFIGGFAQPYGKADVVPFDRRFYSGGGSSVRGWNLRELGPGAARFAADTLTAGSDPNLLGGDVKLEASLELRTTFLREVLAADWILALFTDAGNVWFGPRNPGFGGDPDGRFRVGDFYKEFGVGSGLGLRLAWEYLIARLDFAVKVHDPLPGQDGLFPDGLRLEPHFGIGHAF